MKSKVIIAVVVLLIIVIALVLILNKNNTKLNGDNSGDIGVVTEQNQKYLERIDIDVKDGYTLIEKKNITTSSKISVEAITYKEVLDDAGVKTLVNIYLKNISVESINKNEQLTISLYDKNHNLTHRFGGIIESGLDITPNEMTLVKTQFISKAEDNVFAEVSLESEKEDSVNGWQPSGENEYWSAQ